MRGLERLVLPKLSRIPNAAANSAGALRVVDLGNATSIIMNAFITNPVLDTLILRSTSVVALIDVIAFKDNPIANGTGHIYVPSSMMGQYQTTLNAKYVSQLRAIEDYPEITGG